MADFRKWFVALAVLVVMVGTAYAQAFQCTANAGVSASVRGEELTAQVGDLLLNCSGQKPMVAADTIIYANVQIFLNTNITSRILETTYNSTEALLALNDPLPGAQFMSVVPATMPPSTVQSGGTAAQVNVFKGVKAGDNSLLWTAIPIIPAAVAPGSVTSQIIRITNVRANASQLFSAGQTFVPQQITMFVTVTSTTSIPINNPTQVVGGVLKGLDFAARNCADDDSFSTSRAQCSPLNSDLMTDPTATGRSIEGLLKFSEGFVAAWKKQVISGQDGGPLNALYANSESGYMNTARTGFTNVGNANTGTRLIARFVNIPAGIKIFVTADRKPTLSGPGGTPNATHKKSTSTTVNAVLVSVTDPTGTGGSAGFPLSGTAEAACASGDTTTHMMLEVPLFGGAGAATWEITETSGTAVEIATFGVTIAYSSSPAANIPALSLGTYGTVSGNFAPISTVGTMSAVAPIPRFADLPIAKNLVNVEPCLTNLLFPFVTARGGFDTGVAISNTTASNMKGQPGITTNLPYNDRPTNGACTLYYWGEKEDGTSLAKPVQTSSVINAGKQLVYTLFGGGMGVDATPGFQGYIIATCNFHLGHGFAFISDLGAQKLAMGYLALVIPTSNTSRRPIPESLGH